MARLLAAVTTSPYPRFAGLSEPAFAASVGGGRDRRRAGAPGRSPSARQYGSYPRVAGLCRRALYDPPATRPTGFSRVVALDREAIGVRNHMLPSSVDVVVVGAGNAAFSAALAAAEHADSVLVLERAPEAEAGGNSRF